MSHQESVLHSDEKYTLFIEGTNISLKVKYLMGMQVLVLHFCYTFSNKFTSLINIRTFPGRIRKYLGSCTVTRVCVETSVILLSQPINFPLLKCHVEPIFKLKAKAPRC